MEMLSIFSLLIFLLSTTFTCALVVCDQCDCILKEDTNEKRGNTRLKPECLEGKVTWTNPYGAMLLELHPGLLKEFQACVIVQSEHTKTIISKEIKIAQNNYRTKDTTQTFKLEPWFTVIDKSREFCVQSSDGEPVLLYIETETSTNSSGLPRVTIHYSIEDYSVLKHNPMEECRPCDERELITAFCTSDFVVVGSMLDVTHHKADEKTKIGIEVDQLISQSTELFSRIKRRAPVHISSKPISTNTLLYGQITAPGKCGIQKGEGTFLFTGRIRLGEPKLKCAPFYETWRRIFDQAVSEGSMECSYE